MQVNKGQVNKGEAKIVYGKLSKLVLLALLLVGCTTVPRYKGVAQGEISGARLGIAVDKNLQVVAVEADSAATKAGVQVGDVLVSLTWVLSEAPTELPGTETDGTSSTATVLTTVPVTATAAPMLPPAGVENKIVPFTAKNDIRTLISYGVPLRLEVIRQGQTLQLTIIPLSQSEQASPASSTPIASAADSF
jgi:hypothetical protein